MKDEFGAARVFFILHPSAFILAPGSPLFNPNGGAIMQVKTNIKAGGAVWGT
jgi:hypothetical protein